MRQNIFFACLLAAASLAQTAHGASIFFQGFETDSSGWNVFGGTNDAVRVASGTNGVTSSAGNFHAEAVTGNLELNNGSAATRWGGYNISFSAGNGYMTMIDVYLSVAGGFSNDTRFDWDSAVSHLDGSFGRDFVFNGGFYNNSDATGSGPRFVFSASNNAGRSGAFPENPGRDPFAITQTGWYTFEHFFHNVGGVLEGDLSILNSSGSALHTWTLSDPGDTAANCCGNRYGWFPLQEFSFLAFDNTLRTDDLQPALEPGTLSLLAAGLFGLLAFRRIRAGRSRERVGKQL
jgi:hypothetical protein